MNRDLLDEIVWPDPPADLGLVEMAGGVASPISSDADPIDFVAGVGPDQVLLVADSGLGVINAVRVSISYLANDPGTRELIDKRRVSVVLNRFDPSNELHVRNRALDRRERPHRGNCDWSRRAHLRQRSRGPDTERRCDCQAVIKP